MKMGGEERRILEQAREAARNGEIYNPGGKVSKRSLKRCVSKDWLNRTGIMKFHITEDGRKALKKREEKESDPQKLGDF